MQKTIIIFVLLLSLITSVSAITKTDFTIDDAKIIPSSTTTYGTYVVSDRIWWDVLGWFTEEPLKEIALQNNTDACVDCIASGEITLIKDGYLIQDILFKKFVNNEWVNWDNNKVNWDLYVENKNRYLEVNDVKIECVDDLKNLDENGTPEKICVNNVVGKKTIDTGEWIPLQLNTIYPKDTYKWKLTATKRSFTSLDWMIKTNDIILDEWAVWGNISGGDSGEVLLIAPANATSYTDAGNTNVNFSASANITGALYLNNISLYTDETGSWGVRNTTNISGGSGINLNSMSYITNISVVSRDSDIQGVFMHPNGTRLYHVGTQNDNVDQYNLGTPWDLTTAVWNYSIDTAANPAGLYFNPDGTYLYIIISSDLVQGVPLSTPWEISSAGAVNQDCPVNAKESITTDVQFSTDGTKMYAVGYNSDNVVQYSSSAWNIDTCSYQYSFSVKTQDDYATGISFNSSGTIMYMSGAGHNAVYQYNLSMPWNISTAVYSNNFSTASYQTTPEGVYVQQNGTNLYTADSVKDAVYRYRSNVGTSFTTQNFTRTYTPAGQTIKWNYQSCDNLGDCGYAIANRTFTFNDLVPPAIEIISPGNNTYNNATKLVNISVSGEDVDIIWYNWSGTNVTYTTPVLVTFNEGSNTLIAKVKDTLGNVNSTNVSFTIDTITPTITDSFANNTIYFNNNITGQFNFSDSRLYRWNVSIDGVTHANATSVAYTSYLYNLSISSATLTPGSHTLTLFASDSNSTGDLNTITKAYTFYTINASNSYTSPVYEYESTSYNLYINIGNTPISISNFTGLFLWNNTEVNSTKTSNATAVILTSSYDMPGVSASTNVTFTWNVSINGGAYSNYTANQTITPVGIGPCPDNPTWYNALNITFYDEETNALVNTTLNIHMAISSNVSNTTKSFGFAFRNSSNYSICINSVANPFLVDMKMEYEAANYAHRNYYIDNYYLTSTGDTLKLYMINGTKYSDIIAIVYDSTTGKLIEGATIKALRYFPENDSGADAAYKTVEVEKTDVTGRGIMKLVLVNVWYKFIVEYPVGTVKKTTEIEKIIDTTKYLPISLSVGGLLDYNTLLAINSEVTCTPSTQTCRFTWSNPTGVDVTGTLKIYQNTGFSKILITSQSATSSAATLAYSIPGNISDKLYVAEGWIT